MHFYKFLINYLFANIFKNLFALLKHLIVYLHINK